MPSITWLSKLADRIQYRLSKRYRNISKRFNDNQKKMRKILRIVDGLMIPAIHMKAVNRVESLMNLLDTEEIRARGKITIMGISRLLIENGRTQAAARILNKYIRPSRADQLWYFLEPLLELEKARALEEGPQREFCRSFHPPSSLLALEWIRTEYKAADGHDRGNFERFIIEPLRVLSMDDRNLMDIRFSSLQRSALLAVIKSSLVEKRPFSLIRLGDGEAYPYPVPEVEGLEASLFENDITNFELHVWGSSPPPQRAREDFIWRFRDAVAQCDVLGVPSAYRIIRNLTRPYSRYGERRNQRAFMRILGSVGNLIPVAQKLFTEERCQRIRGAIDERLLAELASMAGSVVLVSSRPDVASKFAHPALKCISVPGRRSKLFKTYPEIIKQVRESSGPGAVVFVGAGIIAKILVHEARQAGAVALDVGSLIDYMVGLKTRTIADLV